jgi:hypothetical protein
MIFSIFWIPRGKDNMAHDTKQDNIINYILTVCSRNFFRLSYQIIFPIKPILPCLRIDVFSCFTHPGLHTSTPFHHSNLPPLPHIFFPAMRITAKTAAIPIRRVIHTETPRPTGIYPRKMAIKATGTAYPSCVRV